MNTGKHILLISSDQRVLTELESELITSFEISGAYNGKTALGILEKSDIDLAVVYLSASGGNAFSVFSGIYEHVKHHKIPFVFLAEKGNDTDENIAFTMGASDYLTRRRGTAISLVKRLSMRIKETADISFGSVTKNIFVGKTVLIADDQELNREIVSAMLERIEGLALHFASGGDEAVAKYSENPDLYAFILMDVQMPGTGGLAAAKMIRGLDFDSAKTIPIIAMTGGVSDEEISLCLDAGMDTYLPKPFVFEHLLAIAAEYCS